MNPNDPPPPPPPTREKFGYPSRPKLHISSNANVDNAELRRSCRNFEKCSNLLGTVSVNPPSQSSLSPKEYLLQLRDLQNRQQKLLESYHDQLTKTANKAPIVSSSEVVPESVVVEQTLSSTSNREILTNHSVQSDDSRDDANGKKLYSEVTGTH